MNPALTIRDIWIHSAIEGAADYPVYASINGVNVPMRLIEWDKDNECIILHEEYISEYVENMYEKKVRRG